MDFSRHFIMFLLLAVGSIFTAPLSADNLRIATYNIWNPIFEEKYAGKNTWEKRLPNIIENIITSNSDVLCLQEVGKRSYLDIVKNPQINAKYESFYISHAPTKPDQKEGRDGLAFFYDPEKVTLRQLVQSLDGSRPTHRRDYYVDLKLKSSKPINFRIASTHVDSDMNLEKGNKQLLALVKEALKVNVNESIDFVVLCGDFNEGEKDSQRPRFEIMNCNGFITDGSTAPTRPESLNVRHNGHIDWIYFKSLSDVSINLIEVKPVGDEKASDHKLTITDVQF